MNFINNIIMHILATICVAIPVYNVLPFKISIKKRIILISILFFIDILAFPYIGSYINIIAIPMFMGLIALVSKKYKLIQYTVSILGYLFTVLINNLIIGILMINGFNIFDKSIYISFLFQIVYFIFLSIITYKIGDMIKIKQKIFEDFYIICNNRIKKAIIILPVTLVFGTYIYLIISGAQKNSSYPEVIIINAILMTFTFFVIITFLVFFLKKLIYKLKRYNKALNDLSKIYDVVKQMNEEEKKDLERLMEEEKDLRTKNILKDIIYEDDKK